MPHEGQVRDLGLLRDHGGLGGVGPVGGVVADLLEDGLDDLPVVLEVFLGVHGLLEARDERPERRADVRRDALDRSLLERSKERVHHPLGLGLVNVSR